MGEVEETSLVERVVLCSLISLEEAGETPVDTARLRETIWEHLDAIEGEVIGRPSEVEVMRALNGLTATGLVDEQRPEDRSPTGKGRPEYVIAADSDAVRAAMADDGRVAGLLE